MLNPIKILLFWWSLLFPLSVHLVSCLFHVKERGRGGKKKKASLGFNFGLHALVHPVASVQMLVRLLHPAARGEGGAGSLLDWGDPLVSGWKWGDTFRDMQKPLCMFSFLAPTREVRSFWGSTQPMALGVWTAICGTGGDATVPGSCQPRPTAPGYPTGFHI